MKKFNKTSNQLKFLMLLVALVSVWLSPLNLYSQTVAPGYRANFPQSFNGVNCVLKKGDTVIVGTNAAQVIVPQQTPGSISFSEGSVIPSKWVTPQSGISGSIQLNIPDGSGGRYLFGNFTNFAGTGRNGAVRLNADESINSAFTLPSNVTIFSANDAKIKGSWLYLAGSFYLDGSKNYGLIALNPTTGELRPDFPRNGSVPFTLNAMDFLDDDRIACGGSFTSLYAFGRPGFVLYNSEDMAPESQPASINTNQNATISKVIPDGSGGYFVLGELTSINGTARTNIARFNSSHQLLAFNGTVNGPAYDAVVVGSNLYVVGSFSQANGQNRQNFAGFNITNSSLLSVSVTVNSSIKAITYDGTNLWLGGGFSTFNSVSVKSLVKINTAGVIQATTNNFASFGNINSLKFFNAQAGPRILVGGSFSWYEQSTNTMYNHLIGLSTGGVLAWGPSANDQILGIEIYDNNVWIAGGFTTIDGQASNRVARFNNSLTLTQAFTVNFNQPVLSVAATTADEIVAAGWFDQVNGQTTGNLVKVKLSTQQVIPSYIRFSHTLNHLYKHSSTQVIVGSSNGINLGRTSQNNFVTYNINTGLPIPDSLNLATNGSILALKVIGEKLYIGFQNSGVSVRGVTRNHLARLNKSNLTVDNFNPSPNGIVYNFEGDGNGVWLAGNFSVVAGQTRNRLVKIDTTDGGPYTALSPHYANLTLTVRAILKEGSRVYFGGTQGNYLNINNFNSSIGAIDLSTNTIVSGWGPFVFASTITKFSKFNDNQMLISTDQTNFAVYDSRSVYAYKYSNGELLQQMPLKATDNAGNNVGTVNTLHQAGQRIYIGGSFERFNGQSRRNLVVVNANTLTLEEALPQPNSTPSKILEHDHKLMMIGTSLSGFTAPGTTSPIIAGTLSGFGMIDLNTNQPINLSGINSNQNINGQLKSFFVKDSLLFLVGNISANRMNPFAFYAGLITLNMNKNFSIVDEYSAVVTGNGIYDILIDNNIMYLGGNFSAISINGISITRSHLVAFNMITKQFTNLNVSSLNWINGLKIHNGLLHMIGSFSDPNGAGSTIRGYHRINLSNLTNNTFPTLSTAELTSFDLDGDVVILGGGSSIGTTGAREPNASPGNFGTPCATASVSATPSTSNSILCSQPATISLPSVSGATYLWNTGETSRTINVSKSGRYSGKVITSGGCNSRWSDPFSFQVGTQPNTITLNTNKTPTGLCNGDSVLISIQSPQTGVAFFWKRDGNAIGNTATTSFNAKVSGVYTVQAISGPCSSNVATVTIDIAVGQIPGPVVTNNGSLSACAGDTVVLTGPAGQTSYLWSNNATTRSIKVASSGTLSLRTVTASGCTTALSSAQVVTIHPKPDQPSITASGFSPSCTGELITLYSNSNGDSYIWSNGDSDADINITASGTYTVIAVSAQGCSSAVSDPFEFIFDDCGGGMVWTGAINLDFNNSGNWLSGVAPTRFDSIIVRPAQQTPVISSPTTIGHLTVLGGATITVNSPLTITRNLIQDGNISGNAEVILDGNLPQTMSGNNLNLNNVVIDNTVDVNSPMRLRGTLDVTSGSIDLNNQQLTLASTPIQTARLLTVDPNEILNASNVRAERYLATPQGQAMVLGRWYYVSAPVSGATLSDWSEQNNQFAANTFNQATPNLSSVWMYNPQDSTYPQNSGWVKPTSASQFLQPGEGFRVWFRRSFSGYSATEGALNLGTINYPAMKYRASNGNGYNLVGNPYAATINWDAPTGWTKNQVNDAIYIYDDEAKAYATYVTGVGGINGGTNLIPSGQGFFVEARNAAASMSVNANAVVSSGAAPEFRRSGIEGKIKIQVQNLNSASPNSASSKDEAMLAYHPQASKGKDSYDAYKMAQGTEVELSLQFKNQAKTYAIATTSLADNDTVYLRITGSIAQGSPIVVRTLEKTGFNDYQVVLYDRVLNRTTFTIPGAAMNITADSSQRYALIFTKVLNSNKESLSSASRALRVYPNPFAEGVTVFSAADAAFKVTDLSGKTVASGSLKEGDNRLNLSYLPKGVYTLQSGVQVQRIVKE